MASIEIALLEVPDDADPNEVAMTRARYVINALFAAYGDTELKPGSATLTTADVEATLVMALALVHSMESGLNTRKDFRDAAEDAAKNLWRMAIALRENMTDEDRAELGLATSRLN